MRGFTLAELAVTVTIFAIIGSLALARYPEFSQRTALTKTAQEVALALRKAQALSLGVRGTETSSGTLQFPSYGVRFRLSTPRQFFIFADLNGNSQYNSSDIIIETFTIQSSPVIVDICTGEETLPVPDCSFSIIDIVYSRPQASSQYPVIIFKEGGVPSTAADAEIKIQNPARTMEKIIVAWTTGQVAVK